MQPPEQQLGSAWERWVTGLGCCSAAAAATAATRTPAGPPPASPRLQSQPSHNRAAMGMDLIPLNPRQGGFHCNFTGWRFIREVLELLGADTSAMSGRNDGCAQLFKPVWRISSYRCACSWHASVALQLCWSGRDSYMVAQQTRPGMLLLVSST